jgi:Tol biopolymer transport system component
MAELREIFEMTTTQVEPDKDSWQDQQRRQRRTSGGRKLAVFATVAAIVAAFIGAYALLRPAGTGTPADEGPSSVVLPAIENGSYMLNVRTGETELFAPVTGRGSGGFAYAPSPDGTMIAYNVAGDNDRDVWLANADGSGARPIWSKGSAGAPVWSPDGNWIAFGANAPTGSRRTYVVDAENPDRVTGITREGSGAGLSWSPDAETLYYVDDFWTVRRAAVYVNDQGEPGLRRAEDVVGGGSELAEMPSVSPDGTTLAYVSSRSVGGVDKELRLIPTDGGTPTTLVPEMPGLADPRWSPDGRTISFKVDGDDGVEAWVVDIATGEATRLSHGYPFSWADDHTVMIDVFDQ